MDSLTYLLDDFEIPLVGGARKIRPIHELVSPTNGRAIHRLRESRVGEDDLTLALLHESDLTGDVPLIRHRTVEDVSFSDWARGGSRDARVQTGEEDDEIESEGDDERKFLELLEASATALNALVQALRRRGTLGASLGVSA